MSSWPQAPRWRVLTDANNRIADEAVMRHCKIVRCWHVLVDAPGEIVFGAVARTKISTEPVGGKFPRSGLQLGHAAQMRANPNDDEILGFYRAMPIFGVARLLRKNRIRIRKKSKVLWLLEDLQFLRRATDDEYRGSTPLDYPLVTRFDARKIDIEWNTFCEHIGARRHGVDERPNCDSGANDRKPFSQRHKETASRLCRIFVLCDFGFIFLSLLWCVSHGVWISCQ